MFFRSFLLEFVKNDEIVWELLDNHGFHSIIWSTARVCNLETEVPIKLASLTFHTCIGIVNSRYTLLIVHLLVKCT